MGDYKLTPPKQSESTITGIEAGREAKNKDYITISLPQWDLSLPVLFQTEKHEAKHEHHLPNSYSPIMNYQVLVMPTNIKQKELIKTDIFLSSTPKKSQAAYLV